jgi:serine/threonine protein kinase
VISAAQSLEKKKIPHGEIRPENVLLTPEGFVKIFDNSLISSQTSAYARALSGNIDSLLSPKMMASLSKKESKPRHDAHKSDVFALGLTILHAATLENSINVYDFAQLLVDYSQIQRMLLGARSKYSEFFVNFIMEMLNQDELQRPSFQNLLDILSPYESSIREMKPFIYVPQQRLGRYQQFQQPGIPQGTIITKSPMRTVSPAHVINHAIPPQITHRNNSPNFVAAPAKSPIRTPNTLKHQVFVNVSPKPTASNQFSPRGIPNNIPQHTASSSNFQFSPQNPSYSLGLNQQNTPQYGQVLQNSSVPVHISQQLGHSSGKFLKLL